MSICFRFIKAPILRSTSSDLYLIFQIVPLAGLLAFATEELALRVGQTLGGLLNATFGNAVEVRINEAVSVEL